MEAEPRSAVGTGPNRRLRAGGKVPAVLYGDKKDSVPLAVDPKELIRVIRSHGGINTIFELAVQGTKGKVNVMIKDYQLEPVEHVLLHADLVRVAMDKQMTLDVTVELTGTATGVKVGGGMLDFVARTVEISCLPADIPETIVADVTEMDIGHYLRAGELALPERIELLSDPAMVIAHVLAPREEEVVEEEGEEGAEGVAEGEGEATESKTEGADEGKKE